VAITVGVCPSRHQCGAYARPKSLTSALAAALTPATNPLPQLNQARPRPLSVQDTSPATPGRNKALESSLCFRRFFAQER